MCVLHGGLAWLLTALWQYCAAPQRPGMWHVPYMLHSYCVYVCIKSLLYERSISQMLPIQGCPYHACVQYVPCISWVSRVHVPYMHGTVISNARYIAWYKIGRAS